MCQLFKSSYWLSKKCIVYVVHILFCKISTINITVTEQNVSEVWDEKISVLYSWSRKSSFIVRKLRLTLLIRRVRAWPETPLVAFEAKLWKIPEQTQRESSVPAELCLPHSSAHHWTIRRQKSSRKELANAGILLRPWLISLGHLVHRGFIFLNYFFRDE